MHINKNCNMVANKMSRDFGMNTEWNLFSEIFRQIVRKFDFTPEIDLFPTCLNYEIDEYAS